MKRKETKRNEKSECELGVISLRGPEKNHAAELQTSEAPAITLLRKTLCTPAGI